MSAKINARVQQFVNVAGSINGCIASAIAYLHSLLGLYMRHDRWERMRRDWTHTSIGGAQVGKPVFVPCPSDTVVGFATRRPRLSPARCPL